MTKESGSREGLDERVVLVAAGLAGLAADTLGAGFGIVRGLLRRSDAADVAADAGRDLEARGRLVLDKYASPPPAHLEVLARHALARRAADGG